MKKKMKAIVLRSKSRIVPQNIILTLNSCAIEIVSNFKSLGALCTETLSCDGHVNHIISKLGTMIGIFCRHWDYLVQKIIRLQNSVHIVHKLLCFSLGHYHSGQQARTVSDTKHDDPYYMATYLWKSGSTFARQPETFERQWYIQSPVM